MQSIQICEQPASVHIRALPIVPQFSRNDPVPSPLMDLQNCPLKIDQLLHSNKKSGYTLFYSEFKIRFTYTPKLLSAFSINYPPPPPHFISSFGGRSKDKHFEVHAAESELI